MQWPWQRKDEELDAEIRQQLDMAARERMERGESAEQARLNVRREFGNVGLVKEVTRAMWGGASIESLWQDVRFGVRMLAKQKLFTAAAVLCLALGLGAHPAIFSVVDAILLRPLPYPQPERLVRINAANLNQRQQWEGWNSAGVPLADFRPRGVRSELIRCVPCGMNSEC